MDVSDQSSPPFQPPSGRSSSHLVSTFHPLPVFKAPCSSLTHTPAFSTVKSFTSPHPKVPPNPAHRPHPVPRSGLRTSAVLGSSLPHTISVHILGAWLLMALQALFLPHPHSQAPRSRCLPSCLDHCSPFRLISLLLHCPVSCSPVDGVKAQF